MVLWSSNVWREGAEMLGSGRGRRRMMVEDECNANDSSQRGKGWRWPCALPSLVCKHYSMHNSGGRGMQGRPTFCRAAAARLAAVKSDQQSRPESQTGTKNDPKKPWIQRKFLAISHSLVDLLRNPSYSIPLLLNVTGSVWFFLLIGQAGTSCLLALF